MWWKINSCLLLVAFVATIGTEAHADWTFEARGGNKNIPEKRYNIQLDGNAIYFFYNKDAGVANIKDDNVIEPIFSMINIGCGERRDGSGIYYYFSAGSQNTAKANNLLAAENLRASVLNDRGKSNPFFPVTMKRDNRTFSISSDLPNPAGDNEAELFERQLDAASSARSWLLFTVEIAPDAGITEPAGIDSLSIKLSAKGSTSAAKQLKAACRGLN